MATTYSFTADAASRIASAVKRVEATPRNTVPQQRRRHVAGSGGSSLKLGKLIERLTYATTAGAQVMIYAGTPGLEAPTGSPQTCFEWMLRPGEYLDAEIEVVLASIGGALYVIAAQCPPQGS